MESAPSQVSSTDAPSRPSLTQRLEDPNTAEALHRLLDHALLLDQTLQVAGELPNLLAIAVDFFDAVVRQAAADGVNVEQRATDLLRLLAQISEPENLHALESLVRRLPQLAQGSSLLDELPNLLAVATDVLDEYVVKLKQDGIELEDSLRRGLHAALYLGGQIREEELDRIGYLLKSEVMSKNAVETVGIAGTALSSCREGTCDQPVPPKIGIWGVLKAMRDPNTQRAMSFAMQFAKCFGNALGDSHPYDNCSKSSK